MSRLRAAWRLRLAHLRYSRALAARRQHCGGMCTTADRARVTIPAQRRAES